MRAVSPLDRPMARVIAGLCFIACAGALIFLHRDDLFPPEVAVDDALAACISARFAPIDTMLRDKLIDGSRAALFRRRAEALCAVNLPRSRP